ncbi:MAG: ABC transporter ATP-binding protein/permease [Lachnospiraceae bacterium]|nr:ABC transporter ATP-binding protein/permease [Lachnospiraceae bacterium]
MKTVLSKYLRPYYGRMLLGFVIKFTGTIMDLCLPWILAYMIDTVIPEGRKNDIFLWGLAMLVCSVLALTFNVIANRMASKVARDTTETLRHDLFHKIMWLSNTKTDAFTKPSLISRLTTDTYNIQQMLGRVQRLGVRAPILVAGGILVTLTLDPVLTLVLVSVMPLTAFVIYYFSRKSIPMYNALQRAVDRFVRLLREDIAGIRVIKALSKTDYEKKRYGALNQDVVTLERKADITMAIVNPATNLFLNLGLVFVVIVGAYRVNQGSSEVGKILAFLTYFTIILNAMINISKMFVIISRAVASADRIMEVIETPDEVPSECCARRTEDDAYIRFEHVTFAYGDADAEPNLTDISFALKKGETLGIIGATGSGKSTLAALLMRFYEVSQGSIYIKGTDIRALSTRALREKFGVVFQNDTIFEDSIAENVRMGRTLTEDDIRNAVAHAKAKEFVEEAGRGYDNHINVRGANLSGGQKQRILIARALAAHPDILILDDSSSALDYKTDSALRHELAAHYADTTKLIIAQRVSSILHADHIMVLEDGKMIGYGTHEELLERCEVYREIRSSQM